MRVRSIASAKRSGSALKPGASTEITAGVNTSAIASSTTCTATISVKMRSANSLAGVRPVLGADARIGRHEGGVERAFGEDRAEMVGQPQRDEEGVGDRPRAQDRGQHDVARKAGDAREQREAADCENASEHDEASKSAFVMAGLDARPSRSGWHRTRLSGNARAKPAHDEDIAS